MSRRAGWGLSARTEGSARLQAAISLTTPAQESAACRFSQGSRSVAPAKARSGEPHYEQPRFSFSFAADSGRPTPRPTPFTVAGFRTLVLTMEPSRITNDSSVLATLREWTADHGRHDKKQERNAQARFSLYSQRFLCFPIAAGSCLHAGRRAGRPLKTASATRCV